MQGTAKKNIFYGSKVYLRGEVLEIAASDVEEMAKFVEFSEEEYHILDSDEQINNSPKKSSKGKK